MYVCIDLCHSTFRQVVFVKFFFVCKNVSNQRGYKINSLEMGLEKGLNDGKKEA